MCIKADRGVCKTTIRNKTGKIDFFKVLLPLNGVIVDGEPVQISRSNLILDIRGGKTVVTIVKEGGAWVSVADVRVTSTEYLRAVQDDADQDDLGELPTFTQTYA
jgi:hypothetical protein